jgi:hypothetical protein
MGLYSSTVSTNSTSPRDNYESEAHHRYILGNSAKERGAATITIDSWRNFRGRGRAGLMEGSDRSAESGQQVDRGGRVPQDFRIGRLIHLCCSCWRYRSRNRIAR